MIVKLARKRAENALRWGKGRGDARRARRGRFLLSDVCLAGVALPLGSGSVI